MTATFHRLESQVRSYCRNFPTVFTRAQGALLYDERGKRYIDFLAGAGTLNYGHNNPRIKPKLIEYLASDGVLHGLDMHTTAKRDFLETFERTILWPLECDYKIQFPGPTGTNAVEAAMKLARKVTGRTGIISFTNGFHGVTMGSVAATGNSHFRDAVGVPLSHTAFMPYDGYLDEGVDTIAYLHKFIEDTSSGLDLPAAVIVETVQGEGGVNVASFGWLRRLEAVCREFDILLIVDDVQVGCGRTGTFFSFEEAGITPDIVVLSKSLSAYGLPMSLVLMRSELDCWKPGEHNGTFRGNNLAFVAATEALRLYWTTTAFTRQTKIKGQLIRRRLERLCARFPNAGLSVRGRGMIQGLVFDATPELAGQVTRAAFAKGLVIETSGSQDRVLKFLPPLVIEDALLDEGMSIAERAIEEVITQTDGADQHDIIGVK